MSANNVKEKVGLDFNELLGIFEYELNININNCYKCIETNNYGHIKSQFTEC